MNRKKGLSLFLFLTVFGLAGVAVYLGFYLQNNSTTPSDTNALTPAGCQNLTMDNLGTNQTPTVQYCPGNGGILSITGITGQLAFYCDYSGSCSPDIHSFTVNDSSVSLGSLTVKAPLSQFHVVSGDTITIKVQDSDYTVSSRLSDYSVGWISPESGHQCVGRSPADNGVSDISGIYNKVIADGYKVLSEQCWADTPINDQADFDFNDFGIIVAYQEDATPTPSQTLTPTVTRTATPTPSGTPSTTPTVSPTLTHTVTPSVTRTATPTVTRTPTSTPTGTLAPSNTPQPSLPPKATLPPTALIDDKTDTFVFGGLFILLGFGLYAYVRKNSKEEGAV